MSSNDEILIYLDSLLEHRAVCRAEHCPACLSLQGILEGIRYQMFSGPIYPEVMIATRSVPAQDFTPSRDATQPAPLTRKVRGRTTKSNRDYQIHT
jgi:hypothetical protein